MSYALEWALWSNGLEKERRIQLPTGARIDVSDPAVWRFPEGTLLLKDFSVRQADGNLKNVETRVLGRHDEKWTGVVYLWEDDQLDAVFRAIACTATTGRSSSTCRTRFLMIRSWGWRTPPARSRSRQDPPRRVRSTRSWTKE